MEVLIKICKTPNYDIGNIMELIPTEENDETKGVSDKMPGRRKNVIDKASPHTIKKFELIEEYIKSWAQKLLLNESCNGLIFIDCMCNSGMYTDGAGQSVKGTAVRVSEALQEAART